MIRNFFKIIVRNTIKNKAYFFINILGLSLAMACCIVAFINYKYSADYDQNHQNGSEIYKVHINKEASGTLTEYGVSPLMLGPSANDDIPAVSDFVRYHPTDLTMKVDDKVFAKDLAFADPSLFELFTFPVLAGESTILNPGDIVISTETASVYFGDADPLGKRISLVDKQGLSHGFIVRGVLETIPQNSSIHFDGVINFENFYKLNDLEKNDWARLIGATFLRIPDNENRWDVTKLLDDYVGIQNEKRSDFPVASYKLMPFTSLGRDVINTYSNYLGEAMDPVSYYAPMLLALLMLLIAIMNYTNTSIAISGKRLKEIGIRKVIGGSSKQLMLQFIVENLFICAIAIILSLVIATYLVPAYGAMWDGMILKLDFAKDLEIYVFLFGLLLFSSLLSGTYPSIYVNQFQPVQILRGSIKVGTTSKLSKTLLSLQIAFTLLTLVCSVAFVENAKYQKEMDFGFAKDGILVAELNSRQEADQFSQLVKQDPAIQEVQLTSNHVGRWLYARSISTVDRDLELLMMEFAPGYMEFMDLKVTVGRSFSPDLWESERENAVIVNQALVRELKWDEPLGQTIVMYDTVRLNVIGVTEDFYYNGLWEPVRPAIIRVPEKDNINYVLAKVSSENMASSFDLMESSWLSLFPDRPFEGFYHEDGFKNETMVNNNIVIIFSFLGLLAILLSTIGLFTLVSLNLMRRVKEIGIRKVLGAKVSQLVILINLDFALIVGIGIILGIGLGFLMSSFLLEQIFAYYQPVGILAAGVPAIISLSILYLTSSVKILRTARRNPVHSLRYE